MRSRSSVFDVVVRVGAALAMMLILAASFFTTPLVSTAQAADSDASSSANFATWSAVAKAIDAKLASGQTAYKSGDNAGAAADFQSAQWSTYEAANFGKVVNDTIGADKYQSQTQQFQDLQTSAYTAGKEADLAAKVSKLTADLDSTASTLDANAKLAKPAEYAKQRAEQTAKERKALDAKKKKNDGKGDRTWVQVADEMTPILDDAYKAYADGDGAKGAELVNNAYYQYYEKLGFEKNVMNAIGGNRVSQVEYQFKECRQAMNNGEPLKDAKKYVDDLKAMLKEDAQKLDGGAQVNGVTKFITSSVGQAFLVLIREGLEALLVVAAIIAYLVKSDNRKFVKWIYLGVLAGLVGSGIIAVIFGLLFGGSGPVQEIMEGVCALVAMAMLLWTSNWMLNKSSVEAWNRYIRNKTESAVAAAHDAHVANTTTMGTVVSLAMLSFLAVFREGAETVIFYESIYSMSQDSKGMWIGGIAAAVVLVIVFLLIRFTSVKIPIGPFFLVTSILMSVLVVIFAGGGVHALIEGDALSGMYLQGVPTNDWLGFYPYVETIVAQVLAAIAVLALFAVGFAKQRKRKVQSALETK
ncbi:iron permease [Bifidobacterium sp. SMB2]|uniref:Iron permease n=1 Tax=Bifidobacterium saimiriisciurei TaxID=2661627 RepID=A0ABX0CGE5_9BIFI|nr:MULTISPECIES: FTR1 family protein [Bifidobacterium]NEG95429.1 iron permease [Bifidobacterium sp. SMB2]NEH11387.1 iron permease [Bifidobacterium saimiriisciurei]